MHELYESSKGCITGKFQLDLLAAYSSAFFYYCHFQLFWDFVVIRRHSLFFHYYVYSKKIMLLLPKIMRNKKATPVGFEPTLLTELT